MRATPGTPCSFVRACVRSFGSDLVSLVPVRLWSSALTCPRSAGAGLTARMNLPSLHSVTKYSLARPAAQQAAGSSFPCAGRRKGGKERREHRLRHILPCSVLCAVSSPVGLAKRALIQAAVHPEAPGRAVWSCWRPVTKWGALVANSPVVASLCAFSPGLLFTVWVGRAVWSVRVSLSSGSSRFSARSADPLALPLV